MASSSSSPETLHVLLQNLDKKLFPLRTVHDVVNLFKSQLENGTQHKNEPDLSLLSIVAGYIEISLTSGTTTETEPTEEDEKLSQFPVVTLELLDEMYKKFQSVLSTVEKPKSAKGFANRNVIKKISDLIYYSLFRSTHRDKPHLNSLYSYLSGNKLDSFGVAFVVVAACQFLGYKHVHLAISEDHAWVVFRTKQCEETIEVTWHGKGGNEDKRGQDVTHGVDSKSWLYLSGLPVICDRFMEVVASISCVNISLNAASDCLELAELQQSVLWILYDMGHLQKYPMSLGTLGELEEVSPTKNRPSCEEIYKEAIKSGQIYYKNHHVYPYTFLGGYYYRLNKYKETLASWANVGDVMRWYTYNSRDDEEIYKELLEISNEMITYIMKTESSGHSARSILRHAECFANLLRFYDGICKWEEGSLTPILHIGWAKPLVNTISKFDYDIRSQLVIHCDDEEDVTSESGEKKNVDEVHEMIVDEGNNNNTIKEEINGISKEKKFPQSILRKSSRTPTPTLSSETNSPVPLNFQTSAKTTDNIPLDVLLNQKFIPKTENKDEDEFDYTPNQPVITLYSQKMKGLKEILLSEKLNTHAISLQMTAQSQVANKKVRGCTLSSSGTADIKVGSPQPVNANTDSANESIATSRPKRTRRE